MKKLMGMLVAIVMMMMVFAGAMAEATPTDLIPEERTLSVKIVCDHDVVMDGDVVTLSAQLIGATADEVSFQWYANGAAISGANGSSLVVTASLANNGISYTVEAEFI